MRYYVLDNIRNYNLFFHGYADRNRNCAVIVNVIMIKFLHSTVYAIITKLYSGGFVLCGIVTTVDRENFAGLNVRIFNPIEVFAEILSRCPGQKCLLFSIVIERHLYSWENFHSTLENCEKYECLAQ